MQKLMERSGREGAAAGEQDRGFEHGALTWGQGVGDLFDAVGGREGVDGDGIGVMEGGVWEWDGFAPVDAVDVCEFLEGGGKEFVLIWL
jgi:hypothetical protein